MHQQLVVRGLQQAFQTGEGHLQQVVACVDEFGIGDEGGGGGGAEAVGTGPGVIGEGLGERVVFELRNLEGDVVAEAGCAHGLDRHRRANAGLHLEDGHLVHGAAVGIHQGAGAVVELRVARDVALAVDVGGAGQRAVALQEEAVVGEFDLELEGDAVLAQGVVREQPAVQRVCSSANPHSDEFIG